MANKTNIRSIAIMFTHCQFYFWIQIFIVIQPFKTGIINNQTISFETRNNKIANIRFKIRAFSSLYIKKTVGKHCICIFIINFIEYQNIPLYFSSSKSSMK